MLKHSVQYLQCVIRSHLQQVLNELGRVLEVNICCRKQNLRVWRLAQWQSNAIKWSAMRGHFYGEHSGITSSIQTILQEKQARTLIFYTHTRAVQLIACDSHAHLVSKAGSMIASKSPSPDTALCINCSSIWKQVMEIYCQSRSRLYWRDAHENHMWLIAQP